MENQQKATKIVPEISEKTKNIYESFPKNIKEFYNFHGIQMIGCNYPMTLVEELYHKLSKATSDNGEYMEIIDN